MTREVQPPMVDEKTRTMAKDKILKVIKQRSLFTMDIKVKLLIKYFVVPKGEDDIRLVYDATANKLNKCVWVPTFWLPTVDLLVRALDKDSWMTDRDVGDMFLNFQLHRTVVPFTGVDLSSLYNGSEEPGPRWAVWDRNLMGFTASPYNSIKMALIAKEICKGDCHDERVGLDGKEQIRFSGGGFNSISREPRSTTRASLGSPTCKWTVVWHVIASCSWMMSASTGWTRTSRGRLVIL
jgi:hypothetical protein